MSVTKIKADIKEGALTRYGYHEDSSSASRHRALSSAVNKEGFGTVEKRVNILSVFTKHKHPEHEHLEADKHFLERKYGRR